MSPKPGPTFPIADAAPEIEVIKSNGTVMCDDYNLGSAPGVKKAIDEFTRDNKFKNTVICNNRFAKIEKS